MEVPTSGGGSVPVAGGGQELPLMPGGLPHPPLVRDEAARPLGGETAACQPALHHRRAQRIREKEGNLFVLRVQAWAHNVVRTLYVLYLRENLVNLLSPPS